MMVRFGGAPEFSNRRYLIGCDNILAQLHSKDPKLCDKVTPLTTAFSAGHCEVCFVQRPAGQGSTLQMDSAGRQKLKTLETTSYVMLRQRRNQRK